MVYALLPEGREQLAPRLVDAAASLEGVDLVMWRPAPREGAIRGAAGELRFAPGGDLRDLRGGRWSVDGPLAVLDADVRDGVIRTAAYPDALARVWSALTCETSGDVLLSAAPGWSSPTGAGSTTSAAAATDRCTAATHSARLRSAAWPRPTPTACAAGRSPTSRR